LHPDHFAVMGRLVPDAANGRERIAAWRKQPGMLGLRFSFGRVREYADALAKGRLEWIWAAAECARLPIMLMVAPHQLHLVDGIAQRYAELRLVIDHLARQFGKKDEEAFAEFDDLLTLAKRPNVAVKASSLPAYTSDAYPYRRIHSYLRRVYDAFGPKRIFWGTDLTKLTCTYLEAVTLFTEEMPWLSSEDKEWIMCSSRDLI
jgi:L-fuconolactonase